MKLSSLAKLYFVAAPVQAGLVSFAVPKTIRHGDDITVTVTMNSEPGYTWDYVLELSGTDNSLPFGYLGGRPFAAIDLTSKFIERRPTGRKLTNIVRTEAPLGESNYTISTESLSIGNGENAVVRGAVHGTRGVMGMVVTNFKEASAKGGSETSREYAVSKNIYKPSS
ncbi:hypothetical protein ISF_00324 [Cordyceps fumosorosea ARSEF 2679]|uniref:Uncharacterized protein n=1 Tax=Cordyceps fumosorosea (strain ARSEF 2679) TaxID=1081104 RepID=A0A168E655_CORFA|nr:hypothetical protein ISF_00324 [Cordyceps fumosorosea ARSEF 2679]OAA73423.1 hypothetical protein ISF_00324 [Cordyceps fumosorosea ARSEF 2679]